jgi:hypothetical protein
MELTLKVAMAVAEAQNPVGKMAIQQPAHTGGRRGEAPSSVCLIRRGVVRRGERGATAVLSPF